MDITNFQKLYAELNEMDKKVFPFDVEKVREIEIFNLNSDHSNTFLPD